jgi:S-adenosylmethionine:tRNA ribosyltransferase-isomerase
MLTSDFDYNLPQELIAQTPAVPRDHSRLMVVGKKNKTIAHRHFYDIIDYLQAGDLLVWNNSKVFKARLHGYLESTNKDLDRNGIEDKPFLNKQKVEIFLVRPTENEGVWQALGKPGRRLGEGARVRFADDFYCDILLKRKSGDILVQFNGSAEEVRRKANQYGTVPVPPYVKDEKHELETYQTVYAKYEGSVAAPTAGFHFTPELIEKLKKKGVEFAEVTLHVGLGTFLPVKSELVEDHLMHSEWVELDNVNAEKINCAKREGRRVVAVGTTTVRTLEGIASMTLPLSGGAGGGLTSPDRGGIRAYKGDINIFITPGFEFKIVDALITNFHLPKSTLLMLVSAFVDDREFVLNCYQKAVEEKYRFYSFGDAMMIV